MSRPVLLIAGGSRGIGASTAKLAGARGYDVAVNYKSNAKAAASVVDAVKAAGGKAVAIQGDMVIEDDDRARVRRPPTQLGPITHFVHSAGIGGKNSRLDAASAATIREVIDVNLYGGIALRARRGAPHVDRERRQRRLDRDAVVDRERDRRRRRIRLLRRGQRRHRRAHGRACPRGGEGGHPRQRHPPGADRHRDPRARPARSGLRRCCRWAGRASRRRSPKRSCSCCRMRRLTSAAPSNVSRARASFRRSCAMRLVFGAWLPMIAAETHPHNKPSLLRE